VCTKEEGPGKLKSGGVKLMDWKKRPERCRSSNKTIGGSSSCVHLCGTSWRIGFLMEYMQYRLGIKHRGLRTSVELTQLGFVPKLVDFEIFWPRVSQIRRNKNIWLDISRVYIY